MEPLGEWRDVLGKGGERSAPNQSSLRSSPGALAGGMGAVAGGDVLDR